MIPTSIGIMVLGTYATVIYSSEKYLEAGIVTSVFAFRTIIWAIELILGKQIIFINDHENRLTAFYFIGGGVNVILNSLLLFNNIFNSCLLHRDNDYCRGNRSSNLKSGLFRNINSWI